MRRLAPFVAVVAVAIVIAACGGDESGSAGTVATTVASGSVTDVTLTPTGSTVPVPEVDLPDELPIELGITELRPGTCRAAEDGDTVVVNYVGVRSEDGTQFDSNFGGDPYPVTLGGGGTIQGWQEGLVGAKQGERLQLDVPADLAYGDAPPGDPIKAGDALTFVIDVLTVVPATSASDEPTDVDIPKSTGATEVSFDDLVEGECKPAAMGMTGILHLIAARADNGVILQSSWDTSGPQAIPIADGSMLPGMVEGIVGMRPGGRRVISIPYEQAFGEEGYPAMGLPPKTDLVLIVDLLAVF